MQKQAILIIAHNNLNILKKTLKILDSKYFDIYIHIDKKSKLDAKNLENVCKTSKVTITKQIKVRWADYSQVECELLLLKKASQYNKYSYYHLISGVDMPIKSSKTIYNFFEKSKGKEFVHFESDYLPKYKKAWLKYYYIFRRYGRKNIITKGLEFISINIQKAIHINRLKRTNIQLRTGANWFSITHDFVKYILNHEMQYKRLLNYTRSPDEIFIQTILYNSEFRKNLYYTKYDNNYHSIMRLVDWKRGNPYVFREKDYNEIMGSEMMFARKFDENIDKKITNKIFEKLTEGENR